MKITMSYSGGFDRGIELASEFQKQGLLQKLYTPYYSGKYPLLTRSLGRNEDKQAIDTGKVETNMPFCILRKLMAKTRRLRNARSNDRYFLGSMLDRWVASKLDSDIDVLLAESHMALSSMKRVKQMGGLALLDRQSANIEFQREIVGEEYARHGLSFNFDPRDIELGLAEYEEADHIIVPSSFVRDTFNDAGVVKDKISVVTPGIDLTYFPKNKEVKTDEVFRVIYTGGISLEKGVHYLLQAFYSLKLEKAELWIFGHVAPGMEGFLEKYDGSYQLKGHIPNYELLNYYKQGDLFVFPTLQDSFGKVITEAMACGLPVLITDNAGARDVVREGVDGNIVPIRDSEAIAERILYYYKNRNVGASMGAAGSESVHSRYYLALYADRMIELLNEIINVNKAQAV